MVTVQIWQAQLPAAGSCMCPAEALPEWGQLPSLNQCPAEGIARVP